MLLGVTKYLWHATVLYIADKQHLQAFTIRLASANYDGLKFPALRAQYIVKYHNSLIGRQLKHLTQIISFALCGLIPQEMLACWLNLGQMTSLLWFAEIKCLDQYCISYIWSYMFITTAYFYIKQSILESAIQRFTDSLCLLDPMRIINKPKLHILQHIVEDIKRFGPAIGLSTEGFESFNGVFRMCSILSNHQAPSRDIANKFAELNRVKHIISGGFWKDDGQWVQAGGQLLTFMDQNKAALCAISQDTTTGHPLAKSILL